MRKRLTIVAEIVPVPALRSGVHVSTALLHTRNQPLTGDGEKGHCEMFAPTQSNSNAAPPTIIVRRFLTLR